MAKSIVAHIPAKCKVESNPYLEKVIAYRSLKNRLCEKRTAEILSMSNDDAIEFLRSVGFSQIIPGTHFATTRDFAQFFGVTSVTLLQYFCERKLNSKCNPDESINIRLDKFFEDAGLTKHGELVNAGDGSGIFDFKFSKTGTHFVTKDSMRSVNLVTARVAVSAIPFLADHRYKRTYDKSRARALNDELVKFLRQKNEQAQAIAEAEAAAKATAEEEAQKAADLKAALAEETLYQLIKRAVVEVMSGAHISLAAPTTNT